MSTATALALKTTDSYKPWDDEEFGSILHKAQRVSLSFFAENTNKSILGEYGQDTLEFSPEPDKNTTVIQNKKNIYHNVPIRLPVALNFHVPVEIFQPLQEWEGVVSNIQGETFTALLRDVTSNDNIDEEGDFLIEDLRKDDLRLLEEGAIFRWVVGYVIKKDGSKRRSSDIVFRRLPLWTKQDLQEAENEAEELQKSINWQ